MTSLHCTQALHESLKLDDVLWSALPLLGVMRVEADEDEPASGLELRNCGNCHSTLCRVTP